MQTPTHDDLVGIASKWLQRRHSVVVTQMATDGEEPEEWRGPLPDEQT